MSTVLTAVTGALATLTSPITSSTGDARSALFCFEVVWIINMILFL